jgi:hypothetical protein
MFSSARFGLLALGFCLLAPWRASSQDDDLQKKINRAIDKGVSHLKKTSYMGAWSDGIQTPGTTALAAWTLLESGVPANSEIIRKAAAYLRKESIKMAQTYYMALMILFFDRLGEPADEAIIQALGVRLLAGQKTSGGWTYYQNWLGDFADQAWLQKQIDEPEKRQSADKLFPQIRKQIEKLKTADIDRNHGGDNSNTQFAMLALWVARRHGLPVDDALAKVEDRFRESQHAGGGWGYSQGEPEPRASMTCAGLLGLAVGQGVKKGQVDKLLKDKKVQKGLRFLGDLVKNPEDQVRKILLDRPGRFYYFLFSLERMAVVYNVKTIGDKDWYTWGAKILVDKQKEDGSWLGEYPTADTCFALLFLKRANVAHDLTLDLNPILKTPDKKKIKRNKPDDPFDLPREKEKKKIKIRPTDKESGRLLPIREEKSEIRISKFETDFYLGFCPISSPMVLVTKPVGL